MDPIRLIEDQWLSETMQRNVLEMILPEKEVTKTAHIKRAIKTASLSEPVFIYAKLPVDSIHSIQELESAGFRLVDTNLQFIKPIENKVNKIGYTCIRFARSNDREQTVRLAASSFRYSRFHLDPVIPDAIANRIKESWVLNFFLKRRGDGMVISMIDNIVVGFIQFLKDNHNNIVIDLIAVNQQQQRKGIATDMIRYIETELGDFYSILVGTQLSNIPSIIVYQNLGFRLIASYYVFHYHNNNEW